MLIQFFFLLWLVLITSKSSHCFEKNIMSSNNKTNHNNSHNIINTTKRTTNTNSVNNSILPMRFLSKNTTTKHLKYNVTNSMTSGRVTDPSDQTNNSQKNGLPAIEHVFVINLDKRIQRMHAMDEQLKHLHIPYHRFPAIDFYNGTTNQTKLQQTIKRLHPLTKMNYTRVQREIQKHHTNWFNWGSLGCWQSHLQIYLMITNGSYSNSTGPYLILEDDLLIQTRILEILHEKYLYHYLPNDWEMIFLDHMELKCHYQQNDYDWKRPKTKRPDYQYCLIDFTYLTSAYVIRSPDVVRKLVNSGNTKEVQVADWYLNDHFEKKTIRAYAIFQKVVQQVHHKFGTDIYGIDKGIKKARYLPLNQQQKGLSNENNNNDKKSAVNANSSKNEKKKKNPKRLRERKLS